MRRLPDQVDVAIIGAGVAGIAAAKALRGQPLSVALLEARDRIGGRALTLKREGMALDIGCGWLHSADENPLSGLAARSGLTIDRTPPPWDRPASADPLALAEQAEFQAEFDAFQERVAHAASRGLDVAASTLLEGTTKWAARMDAICGAMTGARFRQVSTADWAAYRDTGENWRVVEGLGRLVESLGAGTRVATGCPVESVDRSPTELRLGTRLGTLRARVLIVTIPTSLLASGGLRFDPPLPDLQEAAADLPLGLASKLHLKLVQPMDLPAETQLWGRPDSADTGGYHLRPFGRPLIEAWYSADLAHQLEAGGEEAFAAFAAEELAGLLGSSIRRRLSLLAASMWGRDRWSCGAYSYARPGAAGARSRLAAPAEARILIAGEAASPNFYGTAHGAWLEGERAAREALDVLGLDGLVGEGDGAA